MAGAVQVATLLGMTPQRLGELAGIPGPGTT
jgi:hypothetical protein